MPQTNGASSNTKNVIANDREITNLKIKFKKKSFNKEFTDSTFYLLLVVK